MMKRMIPTMPSVLAGACLVLSAGLAGAQTTSATTTPPQAYPKGQAKGVEGKPLTLEQCREHMAMDKNAKSANDPVMKLRSDQCAELMSLSPGEAVTKMPGERSSQDAPPQAYPKGHAQGAEGKAGWAKPSSMSGDASSKNIETPPQAYPKGQAIGAEGTSSPKK